MRYKKLISEPMNRALTLNKSILAALSGRTVLVKNVQNMQMRLQKELNRINEIINMESDD